MKKTPTASVSKDAELNTYAHLWHASWTFREQAEKTVEGSYYQQMASLIFAAFTLEAFCNHVGASLFSCWAEIEKKLGPHEKLLLICEKLKLPRDTGRRPFQTTHSLLRFRNDLAHGKSVKMTKDFEIPMDEHYENFLRDELQADWQKYIESENLKKVHEDVKAIVRSIHEASKLDDQVFNLGFWGYRAVANVELSDP